jgi:hypothetical protein
MNFIENVWVKTGTVCAGEVAPSADGSLIYPHKSASQTYEREGNQ